MSPKTEPSKAQPLERRRLKALDVRRSPRALCSPGSYRFPEDQVDRWISSDRPSPVLSGSEYRSSGSAGSDGSCATTCLTASLTKWPTTIQGSSLTSFENQKSKEEPRRTDRPMEKAPCQNASMAEMSSTSDTADALRLLARVAHAIARSLRQPSRVLRRLSLPIAPVAVIATVSLLPSASCGQPGRTGRTRVAPKFPVGETSHICARRSNSRP